MEKLRRHPGEWFLVYDVMPNAGRAKLLKARDPNIVVTTRSFTHPRLEGRRYKIYACYDLPLE